MAVNRVGVNNIPLFGVGRAGTRGGHRGEAFRQNVLIGIGASKQRLDTNDNVAGLGAVHVNPSLAKLQYCLSRGHFERA